LVIDAIDFVVHIFSSEQRENYAIEQLWKDAEEIHVDDL
jgi:ribosome-associated protein